MGLVLQPSIFDDHDTRPLKLTRGQTMPILLFIPAIVVSLAAVAYGVYTVKRRRMVTRQRGFPVEPRERHDQT